MDRAERRRQQRLARKGETAAAAAPEDPRRRLQPIPPAEALRLAKAYQQNGRFGEAFALYRRVLATHPDHAESLAQGGVAAFRLGRADDAIRMLRRAVAARHDFADAHNNLAVVLQASGQLDEALRACQRAVRFGPGLIAAHLNLGNVLMARGEVDEAVAVYERAIALQPAHGSADFRLGLALQAQDRLDAAAASLEHAVRIQPRHAEAHYSLGTVLHGLRRLDDALTAYERAIALEPGLLEGLFEVGKPRHIHALFERGDHARAIDALDLFLRRRPGHSCALALKAVALDEIGERQQARRLVDFDRLVRPQRLVPPADAGGLAELNEALAGWIRGHPTLHEAPAAFSVHRGLTTGELLAEPKGPIRVFERMIRAAIEGYRQSLPADALHPFLANVPRRWHLTMWAIIIEAEGFQVPHIHPSGWLSGVYYVALPPVVRVPGANRAGWIEFGEPYRDIAHSVAPELKAYQPEEGLLLMFPSYFYHRTLPFSSDHQRISISFDVVPSR
jgi:tetratricopeptide (TPR) repeat protein